MVLLIHDDYNMTRLEDQLLDLLIDSLPSKQLSLDGLARILLNRLVLPEDFQKRNDLNYIREGQIVNERILDSLFSHTLRSNLKMLLDAWYNAQCEYYHSFSSAIKGSGAESQGTLVTIIEKYVTAYQQLLIDIVRILPADGCDDLFQSVNDASAMEMVLNYGCVLETEQVNRTDTLRYFLKPTMMAPQIMEAVLRVCYDCSAYFHILSQTLSKKNESTDVGWCFTDLVESVVLALKNLEIRTIYNKRVFHFSPQYNSQLGLRYLGWQAGRQESHKEIPPIRLLEKIWYLISDSISNSGGKTKSFALNIHLIGHVQYSQLKSLSHLLYAICRDEAQPPLEYASKKNSESRTSFLSNLSALEAYQITFVLHSLSSNSELAQECAHDFLIEFPRINDDVLKIPSFSFVARFDRGFNLKKASDLRTLFSSDDDMDENKCNAYFILDPSSLYLLDVEPAKKNRDEVLRGLEDPKKYRRGKISSTVANGHNAKGGFQQLIHWLTDQCASSVLHQDIYKCTADLTVLNRIRSIVTSGKGSKKICYLFFTNNEAILSSDLSDLNIARLELYNGYRTGVIRIADVRCEDSKLGFVAEDDELQISMNLWQLLKSISSEICRYLCKYLGFNVYAKSVVNNLKILDNPIFTPKDEEEALVYLFRSIFVRIDYVGLCKEGKPLNAQIIINKCICNSLLDGPGYDFESFLQKIEDLANSILIPALAPEFYDEAPLDHMKREVMIRAIYGRAQFVEDMMLYSLYVNNPQWLLGRGHRVSVGKTIVVDSVVDDSTDIYIRMKELYKRSSFQPSDKSFYAYRMITGDFGVLTSLDRQLIRKVAEENNLWRSQNGVIDFTGADNKSYDSEEEHQVSLNIRRCCEKFGYIDTPLYQNYS